MTSFLVLLRCCIVDTSVIMHIRGFRFSYLSGVVWFVGFFPVCAAGSAFFVGGHSGNHKDMNPLVLHYIWPD